MGRDGGVGIVKVGAGVGGCKLEPVKTVIILVSLVEFHRNEMKKDSSNLKTIIPWAGSWAPSPVRLEVGSAWGWPPCDEAWSAAWALRNCWKAWNC